MVEIAVGATRECIERTEKEGREGGREGGAEDRMEMEVAVKVEKRV